MTSGSATTAAAGSAAAPDPGAPRRTLAVASGAHALHDGYTDLIYLLLPLWQAEFGLGYGALAGLRGLYAGLMAAMQIPAGWLAERLGGRTVLALGTALAALGYGLAGLSGGLLGLALALGLSGIGSATQHPLASAAVSRAWGEAARRPLATYNFAGDLGKAGLPVAVSMLLLVLPWRPSLWLVAGLGLLAALAIQLAMPALAAPSAAQGGKSAAPGRAGGGRGGFGLLFGIGVLDSGVRMGLLTFLPFLLQAKGADLPLVGVALALVFLGGAGGKLAFGFLGEQLGLLRSVVLTECATAAGTLAVLVLPLWPCLVLLPMLGMALNGTSSVLYGTVPELAPPGRAERAFALFYTGTIGSGALSPILYGALGDAAGIGWGTAATAAAALATVPLAMLLAPHLAPR